MLSKLVKHKYTLYIMYALAILNLYNYHRFGKLYCALIALSFFMLSNKFLTKNKSVSIFAAIFLSNFVFGCNKLIEGGMPGMEAARTVETHEAVHIEMESGGSMETRDDVAGLDMPGAVADLAMRESGRDPRKEWDADGDGTLSKDESDAGAARVEAEMDKEGDISVPENGNYVQRRKKENKKEVKNKPGRNVMMVKEQNKECCNQDMSAKEIAIITGSAVASALALIVSVGAIMLVNKTK